MTPLNPMNPITRQFARSYRAEEDMHLREDQFGDLLTMPAAAAEEHPHLRACEQCAAEFAAVRESLGLFREASHAHAEAELRRLPQMAHPSNRLISPARQPAWWLLAAAILLAAVFPAQMHRLRTAHTAADAGAIATASSSQSDEALLDDVDRESSASLPDSMQTLADPSDPSASSDSSTTITTQRKD
jgi:hypothetical protein